MSTLATSVIVFSLAFAGQIQHRRWNGLLVPGIGGQLVCLVALTIAVIGVISAGRSELPPSAKVVTFTVTGGIIGLASFLIGIAAFAVYLIKNLT